MSPETESPLTLDPQEIREWQEDRDRRIARVERMIEKGGVFYVLYTAFTNPFLILLLLAYPLFQQGKFEPAPVLIVIVVFNIIFAWLTWYGLPNQLMALRMEKPFRVQSQPVREAVSIWLMGALCVLISAYSSRPTASMNVLPFIWMMSIGGTVLIVWAIRNWVGALIRKPKYRMGPFQHQDLHLLVFGPASAVLIYAGLFPFFHKSVGLFSNW